MIYFLQGIEGGGPIKIGYSHDFKTRIGHNEWNVKRRLRVLGVINGARAEEVQLHRRFHHLRVKREWFKPEPNLLTYIADNARPWTPADAPNYGAVQVDAEIISKAKVVAGARNVPLAELISDLLRGPVNRELEKEMKKLAEPRNP